MGKLVEGIKVAAKVAEIIVASSIVVELVAKWKERWRQKSAASVVTGVSEAPETE